jgi:hypothetical protein
MADFFTRLAERTLGRAHTIQPLLPSVFAPGATLLDAEPEAERESPLSAPTAERRSPQPAAPQQESTRSLMSSQTNAQRHAEPQPAIRDTVSRAEPIAEAAALSSVQPRPSIDSERAIPQPRAQAASPLEHSAPAAAPIQPRRSRLDTEATDAEQAGAVPTTNFRIDPAAARPRPGQAASDRASIGQPERATLLPLADEPAVTRSQPRPATSSQPELVPRPQPQMRFQPATQAPEPVAVQPAPQIHVSIGRIEVRAVTPTPTPTLEPTPKPQLSLDDYLRAQNGGRR